MFEANAEWVARSRTRTTVASSWVTQASGDDLIGYVLRTFFIRSKRGTFHQNQIGGSMRCYRRVDLNEGSGNE